jgi:MSHA biogenesis protein MshN
MSLVNDMLRDLDARRRDAPGGPRGFEKLVPATDPVRRAHRRSQGLVLTVALVFLMLAAAAGYLFLNSGETRSLNINVPLQAAVPDNMPVPASDSAVVAQLEMMNQRLRELEATNRALQEAQLTSSLIPSVAQPAEILASPITAGNAAVRQAAAPQSFAPRDWSAVSQASIEPNRSPVDSLPPPVQPRQFSQTAQQAPLAQQLVQPAGTVAEPREVMPEFLAGSEGASTLVRSPREMSFRENDLLQVQQALEVWRTGDQGGALRLLEQFSTQHPQAHQSRETLAKLMLQQGDTLAALQVAEQGLQIAPDHTGYRKIKARLLLAAGVPGEAAQLLEFRAPSVHGDAEYHDLLATARLSDRQFVEAVSSYRLLVGQDAQQGRWWYGLAAALDGTGKTFEAVQAYERALQAGNLSAGLRQASQQRITAIRQN